MIIKKIIRIHKFIFFVLFLAFIMQQAFVVNASANMLGNTGNTSANDNQVVDIDQSLKQAFSYSPNLQMMQEARQQAEHEVRRAKAGYYPTIGIWAGAGLMHENTVGTRADNSGGMTGSSNIGLSLSQTLWQGEATSSMVRSRESSLAMSIFDVLDTASTLAFNTISSHVDVVRRRNMLKLAEVNVIEHQKILRILRTRYEQGLSSEGDLEQVISRLYRAQATRLIHEEGLSSALANYKRIIGADALANLAPVSNPTQIFTDVTSVRDACVQNNYNLKAGIAQIDALLGERDFTRAAFAPSISLDAGPNYLNTDRGGDAHELSWSMALNMRWNLYNGGADLAAFEASAAQVRQARKALHNTMDILGEQISVTYNQVTISREKALYFSRASRASKAAKNNFIIQFDAGQKDLLSILDAESEFFTSAIESIISSTDVTLGHYRMHALAGTLLAAVGIDKVKISKDIPVRIEIDNVKAWKFKPSRKENAIFDISESTLHDK